MSDFVTLSCPSCGGRLEITNDIERFACAHCGREHIVKRSGGLVSLSPVVQALRKVEVGVDKTAAELAIVRLQKEIAELRDNRDSLLMSSPRPEANFLWFLIILASVFYAFSGLLLGSLFALIIGVVMGLFGLAPFLMLPSRVKHWDETIGVQLKSVEKVLAKKSTELQDNRNIVSR